MPLPEFRSCGNCKCQWHSTTPSGKKCLPVYVPTCEEGAIDGVCKECFASLSADEIIPLVVAAYRSSNECESTHWREYLSDVMCVDMPPGEHALVEKRIATWVRFAKGDTNEQPFELGALKL